MLKKLTNEQTLFKKHSAKKGSISSFSILYIIQIILVVISHLLKGSEFSPELVSTSGDNIAEVLPASLSTFFMSTFNGFKSAIDIGIFVFMLSGLISVINETGALEAALSSFTKKNKGKELGMIPILLILFAIGGSTFGMGEETIPLYGILTGALVSAGFDTIIALGILLLGSGAGVLGSTINPFATGVAMDSLKNSGITTNAGIVFGMGGIIWITTVAISVYFTLSYAKKIKLDKNFSILSDDETQDMKENFLNTHDTQPTLTTKQKITLYIFSFSFIIMLISFIPWQNFNIHIFDDWSAILTGAPLGQWYFGDVAMWFLFIAIIVALISGIGEKRMIDSFMSGAKEVLPVIMIIVVARGTAVLMAETNLDMYILDRSIHLLQGTSPILFVLGSYIVYTLLSILIPSSSGLAYVSMPIMGGLAYNVGVAPELMIMIFTTTHGVINLMSPTSGIAMGSLEMSKVGYSTWIKFMKKPILAIIFCNILVLLLGLVFL